MPTDIENPKWAEPETEELDRAIMVDAQMTEFLESLNEDEQQAHIGLNCPRCWSRSGQWRGYRRNQKETLHRRRCKVCRRWFGLPLNMR